MICNLATSKRGILAIAVVWCVMTVSSCLSTKITNVNDLNTLK